MNAMSRPKVKPRLEAISERGLPRGIEALAHHTEARRKRYQDESTQEQDSPDDGRGERAREIERAWITPVSAVGTCYR